MCLKKSTIFFLVAICIHVSFAATADRWATKAELGNKLPKTLAPIWEGKVKLRGECTVVCQMKNCSSYAYSDTSRSCKIYSHTNLPKPLPDLTKDWTNQKHQMYYKRDFCPSGWDSDPETKKCYYIDVSLDIDRFLAWGVCEDHLMSELATFQTAQQRENLYEILRNKYAGIDHLWVGYYQWYLNFWPRPVNEIPGYLLTMRGDCSDNNIPNANFALSIEECATKCDKEYRDQCVGFIYNSVTGRCWLKYKLCPYNNNGFTVDEEIFVYDKIHGKLLFLFVHFFFFIE